MTVRVYDEILPEPLGNPLGSALGIPLGLRQYFIVYPSSRRNTVTIRLHFLVLKSQVFGHVIVWKSVLENLATDVLFFRGKNTDKMSKARFHWTLVSFSKDPSGVCTPPIRVLQSI